MHNFRTTSAGLAFLLSMASGGLAQQPSAPPAPSDVYHVHFTKAVPGQAAALGKFLATPDPTSPMPGHSIVLRHQQGDDWDYAVIEHLGTKAAVDAAPTPTNPGTNLRAWHTDTFVSGPPWAEFARAMGLSDASASAGSVYTVALWRAAPGHREQLEQELGRATPAPKVPVSNVLMRHLEGGPWQYLALTRHNSWQDFGTDQASAMSAGGSAPDGWSAVREHSTWHHDTLADRIAPR